MSRSIAALLILIGAGAWPARISADPTDAALPGESFPAERYARLWYQSPFAVASATVSASPDFALLAVAKMDGVSYATMLQKQTQQHFVVTSQEPTNGLTLVSIDRGKNVAGTTASFLQNGQSITLPLETSKPSETPGNSDAQPSATGGTPTYLAPGAPLPGNLPSGTPRPPAVLHHRPRIFVPSPPAGANPS